MNAKVWPLLIVLPLFAVAARAQDSVRDLSGPGKYGKFLTPGQLDRWVFEGEKGETIIAHVASGEFDPVLELAKTEKTDDKVLLEVDDPGNESRFSFRLPEKGQYKIRIHAFKYQGGGNYTLQVQRFQATPLAVGKPLIGTFAREGKSYHYFQGVKDQILIPELKGASFEAWKMLDYKGREMMNWAGSVLIEDSGESCGRLKVVAEELAAQTDGRLGECLVSRGGADDEVAGLAEGLHQEPGNRIRLHVRKHVLFGADGQCWRRVGRLRQTPLLDRVHAPFRKTRPDQTDCKQRPVTWRLGQTGSGGSWGSPQPGV